MATSGSSSGSGSFWLMISNKGEAGRDAGLCVVGGLFRASLRLSWCVVGASALVAPSFLQGSKGGTDKRAPTGCGAMCCSMTLAAKCERYRRRQRCSRAGPDVPRPLEVPQPELRTAASRGSTGENVPRHAARSILAPARGAARRRPRRSPPIHGRSILCKFTLQGSRGPRQMFSDPRSSPARAAHNRQPWQHWQRERPASRRAAARTSRVTPRARRRARARGRTQWLNPCFS